MADFTQIKEYPVIQTVPIKSLAETKEQIANVFGHVATKSFETVETMQKEQKDAMFLHESNQLLEISNKAKADMAANPSQSALIAKNAKALGNKVLDNYKQSDKEKLRTVFDTHFGSVDIEAARNNKTQAFLRANIAWANEMPASLENALKEPDHDKAFAAIDKLIKMNNSLAEQKIITLGQFMGFNKTLHAGLKVLQAKHDHAINGEPNAHSAHYFGGHSFTNDATNAQHLPVNEHTAYEQSETASENTAEAAYADADSGRFPNQVATANMKDHQIDKALFRWTGAENTKALINSGAHWNELVFKQRDLSASAEHSDADKGSLNYLNQFFKKLDNGQGLEIILNQAGGSQIFEEWKQKDAAIKATVYPGATETESKANQKAAITENDVNVSENLQAYYDSMGYPTDKQNVLMPDKEVPIKTAFTKDGDVTPAINTLYSLPNRMQYFAAFSLKSNMQKAALYGAAGIRNSLPDNVVAPQESFDIINAAKDGKDYSALNLGENGEKETTIRHAITVAMSNVINFNKLVPEGTKATGDQWNNGIIENGVNYVKDQMNKGDFEGKNIDKYINDFKRNYGRGFKIYNGGNFAFNLNEVNLTQQEAQAVAYSQLLDVYDEARKTASEGKLMNAQDMSTLFVTNTRDGKIAVVDANGHVVNRPVRATSQMVRHAVDVMKQNRQKINEELKKESETQYAGIPEPFANLGTL